MFSSKLLGESADASDQIQETVRITKTPHSAQYPWRGMLEGQIEVRHHIRAGGYGCQDPWSHFRRLQVTDPDPGQASYPAQFRQ